MKSMRKCTLCPSHQYEYCNKCKSKTEMIPWKLSFDTETCRDVYHILAEFAFGRKSALDARKELENYQIPNKEEMTSSLRKNLEDVYEQTKDYYNIIEQEEKQEVISEEVITNQIEQNNEDITEPIQPRRRRRSRRSLQ